MQFLQKMIVDMRVYDEKSKKKILKITPDFPGKSQQIRTVFSLKDFKKTFDLLITYIATLCSIFFKMFANQKEENLILQIFSCLKVQIFKYVVFRV